MKGTRNTCNENFIQHMTNINTFESTCIINYVFDQQKDMILQNGIFDL